MIAEQQLNPYEQGQVLLLYKPVGWTSFQLVNKIKWQLLHQYHIKKIKIGHAGTLDPLADGLMIVCTGRYTKRIEEFQAHEKEYTGAFTLGATTPCFDMEQPVDSYYETTHIIPEKIYEVAASFIGEQMQKPPVFSAVKIDGKRAYNYARHNEAVEMKLKRIVISEFEITTIAMPVVSFRIVCSKGTYIRSIAHDFGEKLNSGAYLSRLTRTKIGRFCVENATHIEDFKV